MIVDPAAYILSLLFFQSQACAEKLGAPPGKRQTKNEPIPSELISSSPEMMTRRLGSKSGKASDGKSGKARGHGSKVSMFSPVDSKSGKARGTSDDSMELFSMGFLDMSSSGKSKSGKTSGSKAASETDTPTIWPTYQPSRSSPPTTIPPTEPLQLIPALLPSGCDPIGNRPVNLPTNLPTPIPFMTRPTRGNPTTPIPPVSPPGDDDTSHVTFRRGDLKKDIARFGIKVCKGMTVRMVAKANFKVTLGDKKKSKDRFHSSPDGAAVIPLGTGYVYVSNSEVTEGRGGVYGVYFDDEHNVVNYKSLLRGTTRNCSGGATPWGTYVSCEEYGNGQCWQVDPDPSGAHHLDAPPAIPPRRLMTRLGGDGGNYEAVACDNRNPSQPVFFLAEDHRSGALRKYTSPVANWDALHAEGGHTEYLVFLDSNTFIWSRDEQRGRDSQQTHFPNVEGISFSEGLLYFVSKRTFKLYVLDLDKGTYRTSTTSDYSLCSGEFKNSPDQLARNNGPFLYFTEDGGRTPGVYAIDESGRSYAIFEAYDRKYFKDETTGLAFSPDGTRMYACFQDCGCEVPGEYDCGCLFEFWRDDGESFDGATMGLRFHAHSLKSEESV